MLLWINGPGVWGRRWRRSRPSSKWASSSVPPRSAAGTPKCARSWTCTKILVFETIRDSKESPPSYLLGQHRQFFLISKFWEEFIHHLNDVLADHHLLLVLDQDVDELVVLVVHCVQNCSRSFLCLSKKITCFSSDPTNIYGFKEFSIPILLLVQKIFGMI